MSRPTFLNRSLLPWFLRKSEPVAPPPAVPYNYIQFRLLRHPVNGMPGVFCYTQQFRQRKTVLSSLMYGTETGLRRGIQVHVKQEDDWTDWYNIPVVDATNGETIGHFSFDHDAVCTMESEPRHQDTSKISTRDYVQRNTFTLKNGMLSPGFPYPDQLIGGVPHWTEESMLSYGKAIDDCAQPLKG